MKFPRLFFITLLFCGLQTAAIAQPELHKDYSNVLEIPLIEAMESSPAHLYVLSDEDGMAVFRARPDSLQWLYASGGMQRRGDTINTDIRFAYLYGDSNRLTVLEPTSVLGVYSSTRLPGRPLDAARIEEQLYVAVESEGLGYLSLKSPSAVDSAITMVESSEFENENIIDLEVSSRQLFALSDDGKIFSFNQEDGEPVLNEELEPDETLQRIFIVNNQLMGTSEAGDIFEISGSGELSRLGSIDEPVQKMEGWNEWLIIRGESNRLWTSYQNRSPSLWKDDSDAGNFFTVVKDNLWLAENNQLTRILISDPVVDVEAIESQQNEEQAEGLTLKLKSIPDQVIPYQNPLLIGLELEEDYPADQVRFSYRSDVDDANIRGSGFYWQPNSNDTGNHRFRIIASARDGQTDSTSFEVEVRSSNSPPRFNPVRTITIPVGEEFELPIEARDPDGMNEDLIRYMGVDLPEGASIDERTGMFTWTPKARQEGENEFRVIATDQFGAANSLDVTLRVTDTGGGEESDTTDN